MSMYRVDYYHLYFNYSDQKKSPVDLWSNGALMFFIFKQLAASTVSINMMMVMKQCC